jgi:hypothetical protein
MTDEYHGPSGPSRLDVKLPPVAELATLSLGLVVIGGILIASHAPRRPPLGLPVALLVASTLILATSVVTMSRIRAFAWATFFKVFKWALLAEGLSAAMIAFAFIRDHTRGAPLVVVLCMLVIFAVTVPLAMAYTVGRFTEPTTVSA